MTAAQSPILTSSKLMKVAGIPRCGETLGSDTKKDPHENALDRGCRMHRRVRCASGSVAHDFKVAAPDCRFARRTTDAERQAGACGCGTRTSPRPVGAASPRQH